MSTRTKVAVLGLGRMGGAVAARLREQGYDVHGWNRTERAVDGIVTTTEVAEAVDDAAFVVLALFDGSACREVLHRAAADLPPDAVVINISTVHPEDAASAQRLVTAAGASYVHAPVMGSVGAARDGRLTILAGSPEPSRAEPVLASLGTVLPCGDATQAAAAKLIANGVLADAALTVRRGLANGQQQGLTIEATLDVLQRTLVGSLVASKRERLTPHAAQPETADFTVGALRKDVALLASGTGPGRALAGTFAALGAVDDGADIAALARPPAPPPGQLLEGTGGHPEDLVQPLLAYVSGHATGDPSHFRAAFLATAHIEGLRDGTFVSWPLEEYCERFSGHPAADEATRRRSLDVLSVTGNVGHAVLTLHHGANVFTDQLLLVRTHAGWRIANKVYDVTARPEPALPDPA